LNSIVARFLANKCSIASRIDSFTEKPTSRFGRALRKQVEERLDFYETGAAPTKNADAMKAALEEEDDEEVDEELVEEDEEMEDDSSDEDEEDDDEEEDSDSSE